MIRNIILIGIFWLSVYSSCNKNGPCNETVYSFKLNISANPGIDSIAVNDTLWFKIDESTQLNDFISNKTVNFSNASNLSYVFAIRKVISATEVIPAADSLSYFIRKGNNITSLDPTIFRVFGLAEETDRYKLEVGFIPQRKGIFRVLVESSANVYTKDKPCIKAGFGIKFSNADQHFYLGYNISGEQVYYFKVY